MDANDMQLVGGFVADTMGNLESDFPTGKIIEVALVVAVETEDDEGTITTVQYACTSDKGYVARGLLSEAVDAARFSLLPGGGD